MSQITPDLGTRTAAPVLAQNSSAGPGPIGIDPAHIAAAIVAKRADIAALELEWSSAAERAAARGAGGIARLGERETWDRETWNRYLSAASACQDNYLPRLKRLYSQVARLERLAAPLPRHSGFAA